MGSTWSMGIAYLNNGLKKHQTTNMIILISPRLQLVSSEMSSRTHEIEVITNYISNKFQLLQNWIICGSNSQTLMQPQKTSFLKFRYREQKCKGHIFNGSFTLWSWTEECTIRNCTFHRLVDSISLITSSCHKLFLLNSRQAWANLSNAE